MFDYDLVSKSLTGYVGFKYKWTKEKIKARQYENREIKLTKAEIKMEGG